MTTDNPDPLEVADDLTNLATRFADWLAGGPNQHPVYPETGLRPFSTGDLKHYAKQLSAAAIIAQHYAPVIAENERLREEVEKWLLQPEQGGKTRYQLAEGVRAILKSNPRPSFYVLLLSGGSSNES